MGWFSLSILIYFLLLLAECALVAVTPHDLETLRSGTSKSAQRAYVLARQIRPVMSALLLAHLLLKLLIAVFLTAKALQSANVRAFLWEMSQRLGLPPKVIWGIAGALFALALAVLFWGVKKIDLQKRISSRTAFTLQRLGLFIFFWKKLLSPFLKKERTIENAGNQTIASKNATLTQNNSSEKPGEIELLKSIVKFGDVTVKQVMQPRSKVVAVDFRTGFHDLLATVREAGFSRLPVYDEDLDNVTGILYVKDLVPHLDKPDDFEWQSLIRTNVLLAPESKRCAELLQDFKLQKIHVAIVVDEYGGSAGIVTLEDILEEVIGDIRDEFDEESEVRYRKLDDYNYFFEGQALLNDVCRITGLDSGTFDTVRGNADTLAGLVLEIKGDIPKTGAEIAWNGFFITIIAANNRRIEQLKLTLPR